MSKRNFPLVSGARKRVSDFATDTSGSIKVLAMTSMVPLAMMGGLAIDSSEMYRARVNFQAAVDAAAITAARSLSRGATLAEARDAGEAIFQQNIANLKPSVGEIDFEMDEGSCANEGVVANATLRHKVWFDSLSANISGTLTLDGKAGVYTRKGDPGHTNLVGSTTVQCGNDTVEIALVLDNSGSMRHNGKLSTLKAASQNLVNSLHNQMGNSPRPNPVQFSLVPFAATVNIGANNRNKSWMDKTGISPSHWSGTDPNDWQDDMFNFDDNSDVVKVGNAYRTQSGQAISRLTLYDNLSNDSWKGCVEARPYPYHTTDDEPTTSNPATLIVPSFAPDTPDDWSGQRERVQVTSSPVPYCVKFKTWTRNRDCRDWSDGARGKRHPVTREVARYYSYDYQYKGKWRYGNVTTTSVEDGRVIDEHLYQNNYLVDDHNHLGPLDPRDPSTTGQVLDQYKRQSWTTKYFRNSSGTRPTVRDVNRNRNGKPSVIGYEGGPNYSCTTQPLTELTPNRTNVLNDLNSMQAIGLTNIHQGAVWGWRTLSNGEPFTQGRPSSSPDNKKIMILMTDGNHTYYRINRFYGNTYSNQNLSYYGAYGHSRTGRIFEGYTDIANPQHTDSSFTKAMDSHLKKTCDNMKKDNIQIYSIAFDVPNGSSVKTMLEYCASNGSAGTKLYYDARDNAALVQAFDNIAEKISELAVSK
ncbi:MAG: VWA domain-containing protein [Pseudomonadota bacterium]